MRCRTCRKKLSCYVDDELSGLDRRAAEEHLASCAGCRAGVVRLRAIRKAFARLPDASPRPFFYERLMSRMAAEEAPAPAREGWRAFGRLAAAAVLLIAVLGLSLYWVDQQFDDQTQGILARYLEQSSEEDATEVSAIYRSDVTRDAVLDMVIQEK
ncbi:MAG: zf-HC2 domain-containing protein [Candidatus Latescibacteria bacterium]|nr:zf-HC2 domain-containing protein [Candidatus Latescibacterota bacterium]